MVYRKFKDYKLEVIRMIFQRRDPVEIIRHIEDLEKNGSVTPSQIQYMVDMLYNSDLYKMDGPANMSADLAKALQYKTEILVYRRKIIASYLPEEGLVYLE